MRAESALVAGRTEESAGQLAAIAEATHDPQVMDALAMLYRRRGDRANSRLWAERAGSGWRGRLAALPEAHFAHAGEHELAFGSPRRALDLARRNLAVRPYGDARLLMARALAASGDYAAARTQLLHAERGGWRSAPLYVELANVHRALDDEHAAEQARERAVALNPRIFAPETANIWFAHG